MKNIENELCSICHDELSKKGITNLDCSHKFHSSCVLTWLRANPQNTCPLCRADPVPEKKVSNRTTTPQEKMELLNEYYSATNSLPSYNTEYKGVLIGQFASYVQRQMAFGLHSPTAMFISDWYDFYPDLMSKMTTLANDLLGQLAQEGLRSRIGSLQRYKQLQKNGSVSQ